ncbi:Protein GLB-27 [Aphelenchoides avenae]|nr:Protein GLB-27 [Aphelenchus avenae]
MSSGHTPPLARCSSDRSTTGMTPKLERSNSITGSSRMGIPLVPSLQPSQVFTLRKSWKHINTKGLNSVIRRCFERLESSSSAVGTAFAAAQNLTPDVPGTCLPGTIGEHTKYLLNVLDRIIDGCPDVELELKKVGARHIVIHNEFGIGAAEIERFGEIFAEVFLKLDGIRQSKETTKAWRILIAKIVDHVRDGFESELRYQRRRAAFAAGAAAENRRNSMPSNRKASASLRVDVPAVTRKLSHF